MPKKTKARLERGLFITRHIERLRDQLEKFQPFLSRRKMTPSLEEFDDAAERSISQIFGDASDQVEAYQYAKTGEAASLVNLPEEAQESGAHDTYRESLQQRKRVLESCLADLETKRDRSASGLGRGTGRAMDRISIAEYMCHDVRSVNRAATLKEAGRLLQKWKVGSLLVDDGRRYVGIITDTDLSRKAVARGLDPNVATITVCMSKWVVTIESTEPLSEAIALMKRHGIRHLPVTEDGTIIGVMSISDVLRAYEDVTRSR